MDKKLYTVWVGGTEVNDYLFTDYGDALNLANEYIDDGYDDVSIEDVSNGYENAVVVFEI
jgi:hypothetical protein